MLLLDVANVYANAVNRGTDPEALFDAIPLERVAYVHVAGGAEHAADPGVYHDTHTDPVPPAVLTLLERLRERLDVAPAVMLERDGRYPPAAALHAELDAIADAPPPSPGPPRHDRESRRPPASCARHASPAFRHATSASVHAPRPHRRPRRPAGRAGRGPGRGRSRAVGLRPRPARRRPACPAAQAGGRGGGAVAAAGRVARVGVAGAVRRVRRGPRACRRAARRLGSRARAAPPRGAGRRRRRRARRARGDPAPRRATAPAAGLPPVCERCRRAIGGRVYHVGVR